MALLPGGPHRPDVWPIRTFYKFAKGTTDTYGDERYGTEVTRLLGVLDRRLDDRDYLAGELSVADVATVPWINALDFYEGKDAVKYDQLPNVDAWVERFKSRPALKRGLEIATGG